MVIILQKMKSCIVIACTLFILGAKQTADLKFVNVSTANLPIMDLYNNSMDVEAADLDKDGDLDLIIASEFRPNLLLFNDGHGKFTNGTEGRLPKKNHDSEDIAAGDFDGDGDTDIVFVSEDDSVNEYYLNDGKGFFQDVSAEFPVQGVSNAVVAGDFDGDGDLDLVIGNAGQDFYLTNDGKGKFKDETTARMPADRTSTQDVEAADIDKDGDLDLVFGNEDGNKVYINDGKGHFKDETAARLLHLASNEETRKVDIADIDNDGDLDVFFSNVNFNGTKNPANRILVNDGHGFFTDETAKRYRGDNNLNSADGCFVDLDKDHDLDLVVANIFGGYPQVFLNDGKGIFEERTGLYLEKNITSEAIAVEVRDFNNDGFADIYFGVFKDADVLLFGR
jgi:hypothetical protein